MQRWTKGKSLFWGAGIIFGGSLILSRFYQQILLLVARMLPAYRKYVEGLIPFFNEEAQGRNKMCIRDRHCLFWQASGMD